MMQKTNTWSTEAILPGVLTAGLLLFAFFIPLSVSLMEIGFVLACAAMFYSGHTRRQVFVAAAHDPVALAWLLYLAAGLAALVFAVSPLSSAAKALSGDALKLSFYLVAAYLVSDNDFRRVKMPVVFLSGAVVAALIGIGQYARSAFLSHGEIMRAHGTMNAITYAETLVVAGTLALSYFIFQDNWRRRLASAAVLLLIVAAIMFTNSRGPLLALFIGALVAAVAGPKRIRIVLPLAILFAVSVGVLFVNVSFRQRLGNSGKAVVGTVVSVLSGRTQISSREVYGIDRLEMWNTGIAIARDFPVFGIGQGGIKRLSSFYAPAPEPLSNVHNLYIQQLAERGLFGFFSLIFLFSAMLIASWQSYRASPGPLSLWALSASAAFIVFNMTETSFQHAVVGGAIAVALAGVRGPQLKSVLKPALLVSCILTALVLLALIFYQPLRVVKEAPLVVLSQEGLYQEWRGGETVSEKELYRNCPPLGIYGLAGDFSFTKKPGGGLLVVPAGDSKGQWDLQFGYRPGENGLRLRAESGDTINIRVDASCFGTSVPIFFIQDRVGESNWERASVPLKCDGKTAAYVVKKQLRANRQDVLMGIVWSPKSSNDRLELGGFSARTTPARPALRAKDAPTASGKLSR